MNLCSHQVSNCPVYPVRGLVRLLLADDGAPTQGAGPTAPQDNHLLENSFKDNGVAGQQVLDLVTLEDGVFQRCLSA